MASKVSFAGVPFCLPTPELEDWFRRSLPIDGLRISTPERTWPGSSAVGMTYPLRWPHRPAIKLNELFYPTHASRWAEFTGVVDQKGYETILTTCFPSSGTNPASATFTMSQEDLATNSTETITTDMFALPPRPLAVADQTTGLYLVTLVDQRYYLQWSTPGDISSATTWDSILSSVASNVGITLSMDSAAAAYGDPHPKSDLYTKYTNTALLLDAVCWNTGRVIVRQWDGTYFAQNHATAVASRPDPDLLAGGDFTKIYTVDTSKPNTSPNSILPSKVTVTFPYYVTAGGYLNAERRHLPYPLTQGDVYKIDVLLTDVLPDSGYTGFVGAKVFHTTAEAYIALPAAGMPTNLTALQDLADQIATDYYSWQIEGLDETTVGIFSWTPDGINDLLFTWNPQQSWTRIQRKPFNFQVDELLHHFSGTEGASDTFIDVQITGGSDSAGYSWKQIVLDGSVSTNTWIDATPSRTGTNNLWRMPSNVPTGYVIPAIPVGQTTVAWPSPTRPGSWECPAWGGIETTTFTDNLMTDVSVACVSGSIVTTKTFTPRTVTAYSRDMTLVVS